MAAITRKGSYGPEIIGGVERYSEADAIYGSYPSRITAGSPEALAMPREDGRGLNDDLQ